MKKVAITGPKDTLDQLIQDIDLKITKDEAFESEGMDGVQITTFILDLSKIIVPPVAAVLAAKVASRREIKIKIDGIEVSGETESQVLKVLEKASRIKSDDD